MTAFISRWSSWGKNTPDTPLPPTDKTDKSLPRPADVPDDLREAFEERAAIAEYCGGLSSAEAEQLALQWVLGMVSGQPHLQGQPQEKGDRISR